MAELLANNYATTLNGGIDASTTSVVVTSTTGAPSTSAGNWRIICESEIMLVTAVSGTTLTVTRGVEGTSGAAHVDTTAVTHLLTKTGLTNYIEENSTSGYPLIVLPNGVNLASTGIGSDAGVGFAIPINVPSLMLVDKLGFIITTAGSGTAEWGLFDFSASASAATKLAGGSGTLNATGYQTIAATGAPVTVTPGGYALVVLMPAANHPSVRRTEIAGSIAVPCAKFQAAYVWDDTPDFTSGWTTDSVVYNVVLHGRLASGTTW